MKHMAGTCRDVNYFLRAVDRGFSNDCMQRNIPMVHMNVRLFLELIGKSNEFWFVQMRALTKKCKAVIIVCTTHAEAIAPAVKCNERGEHQVKLTGFDQAAPFRFRDAIAIENQAVTGLETGKPQFPLCKRCKHRQVQFLTQFPKSLYEW